MRIGFDVSQTGTAKAGCGYFADGLIRQLAADDTHNEYILYPAVGDLFWDPQCATSTFLCDRPNFRRLNAPSDFNVSREFWRHPGQDFERKLGSPDIFHANNFFCPQGLQRARLVYTLYDLSFLLEPAWTTEQNRIGCFQGAFQASLTADRVVAISEYTRRHFLATFPHFAEERISVIYPASRFEKQGTVARPAQFWNLEPERFWLSVGTLEPRKNHVRLLEAYRRLQSACGSTYPLVLSGGKGWLNESLDCGLQGLVPGQEIVLTGYVQDSELLWLYQNCFAFVYPSLFEGFGMPVLEAMAAGAPVISSATSSLPEVVGKAGILVDPSDSPSIASAMIDMQKNRISREQLKTLGRQQAASFSWTRSANKIRELYEQTSASMSLNGLRDSC